LISAILVASVKQVIQTQEDGMKRIIQALVALGIVSSLAIAPISTASVFAQSGGTFASSIQVQNLSTTSVANINIQYYNQDGTSPTMNAGISNPVPDTVQPGASNSYYPIHTAAGFNGSVVISSDQQVAAISNLVVNSTAQGIDSYVGVQSGGQTIYYPLVMKGNSSQTSLLTVQNTSTSGDATVSLSFTAEIGSSYPAIAAQTLTIKPGASQTYDLNTAAAFSAIPKWVGAATAKVTAPSGGTVAGVAVTVNTKNSGASQLNTYNAFAAGSTTVQLPLIQENNNGNRTSVNCQNIDPSATTTISVAYTGEGGMSKAGESKTGVGPNGLAVFLQNYTGTTKFVGSATVSSNPAVPLVCVVNQQKPSKGQSSSYVGFDPATATTKVILPLIQSKNGTAAKGWVYTSINLATADGASHPIQCTFQPAPGISTPPAQSGTGPSVVLIQSDVFGNAGKFVGGATCTSSDANVKLFAIVNQTRQNTPEAVRDVLASYDGFNIAP
jgi:hypothetical protein